MTDAPSGSTAPVKKATGKAKGSTADGAADGKKRFEVKKVRQFTFSALCHLVHILNSGNSGMPSLYGRGISL
jgi:hypothetical protein